MGSYEIAMSSAANAENPTKEIHGNPNLCTTKNEMRRTRPLFRVAREALTRLLDI